MDMSCFERLSGCCCMWYWNRYEAQYQCNCMGLITLGFCLDEMGIFACVLVVLNVVQLMYSENNNANEKWSRQPVPNHQSSCLAKVHWNIRKRTRTFRKLERKPEVGQSKGIYKWAKLANGTLIITARLLKACSTAFRLFSECWFKWPVVQL